MVFPVRVLTKICILAKGVEAAAAAGWVRQPAATEEEEGVGVALRLVAVVPHAGDSCSSEGMRAGAGRDAGRLCYG